MTNPVETRTLPSSKIIDLQASDVEENISVLEEFPEVKLDGNVPQNLSSSFAVVSSEISKSLKNGASTSYSLLGMKRRDLIITAIITAFAYFAASSYLDVFFDVLILFVPRVVYFIALVASSTLFVTLVIPCIRIATSIVIDELFSFEVESIRVFQEYQRIQNMHSIDEYFNPYSKEYIKKLCEERRSLNPNKSKQWLIFEVLRRLILKHSSEERVFQSGAFYASDDVDFGLKYNEIRDYFDADHPNEIHEVKEFMSGFAPMQKQARIGVIHLYRLINREAWDCLNPQQQPQPKSK